MRNDWRPGAIKRTVRANSSVSQERTVETGVISGTGRKNELAVLGGHPHEELSGSKTTEFALFIAFIEKKQMKREQQCNFAELSRRLWNICFAQWNRNRWLFLNSGGFVMNVCLSNCSRKLATVCGHRVTGTQHMWSSANRKLQKLTFPVVCSTIADYLGDLRSRGRTAA